MIQIWEYLQVDKEMEEFVEIVSNTTTKPTNGNSTCVDAPAIRSDKECEAGNEGCANVKMWAVSGRDYHPTESAVDALKPGQYVVKYSQITGIYFSERDINLDDLLVLPDSNSEKVLAHIEDFWENEEIFREYGFLWKRGIMLWGPPGSGKTCTVQQLSKQIVDNGGITVYCVNPELTAQGLDVMRRIEPDRPLVVIFEDIDAIVQEYGESHLLAMLDGELQVDNVVFVATTNYPGRLDKRFINRPSRFDEIIKIGMPSAAAREYYLRAKNPRLNDSEFEIEQWVTETKGYSVAHLKELIISVECFGKPFEDAIATLNAMMGSTPDSFENDGRCIGFTQ